MQPDDQAVPIRRTIIWVGRAISGLCVLFLALDGTAKLLKPAPVLEACTELGIPESTITGIGILLLACTAAYAVPATAVLGAVLLTGYMGGAIATQLRIGSLIDSHLLFGLYLGLLIWGGRSLRDPRLRALLPLRS
jgi:hypothetical protein